MFDNDHEVKAWALKMWANRIATGNVLVSSFDVRYARTPYGFEVKKLTPEEIAFCVRIRELQYEENQLYLQEKEPDAEKISEQFHDKTEVDDPVFARLMSKESMTEDSMMDESDNINAHVRAKPKFKF